MVSADGPHPPDTCSSSVTSRPFTRVAVLAAMVALVASLVVTSAPASASAPSPTTSPTSPTTAPAGAPSGIHSSAHPPVGASGSSAGGSSGSGSTGVATPLATTPQLTIAQSDCVASTSTAAGLQSQFDQRGPVWGGGDGAQPIPIDGGRTLWLFGDTYIGGGPYGGPLKSTGLVHNSMVVQYNGRCFVSLLGKSGSTWTSAIAGPNAKEWYWPNDGVYDAHTGVLSIVALHVRETTGGQWGWTLLGTDVLRYRVEPSIRLISTQNLFTYSSGDIAQFGPYLMTQGSTVYLYGCAQQVPNQCYAARTDLALDRSALEYLTADGTWSPFESDAAPLAIDGFAATELHVTPYGDGYLATSQLAVLSTSTSGWWGPTPTGPFTPIGSMFDAGSIPANWFTYGGRLISTSAGTIGVYSVNTWDDEGGQVAGVYGPRFVAVDRHVLDRDPFGNYESLTAGPDSVNLSGWSIDPDTSRTEQRRRVDRRSLRRDDGGGQRARRHRIGLPRLRPRPRLRGLAAGRGRHPLGVRLRPQRRRGQVEPCVRVSHGDGRWHSVRQLRVARGRARCREPQRVGPRPRHDCSDPRRRVDRRPLRGDDGGGQRARRRRRGLSWLRTGPRLRGDAAGRRRHPLGVRLRHQHRIGVRPSAAQVPHADRRRESEGQLRVGDPRRLRRSRPAAGRSTPTRPTRSWCTCTWTVCGPSRTPPTRPGPTSARRSRATARCTASPFRSRCRPARTPSASTPSTRVSGTRTRSSAAARSEPAPRPAGGTAHPRRMFEPSFIGM